MGVVSYPPFVERQEPCIRASNVLNFQPLLSVPELRQTRSWGTGRGSWAAIPARWCNPDDTRSRLFGNWPSIPATLPGRQREETPREATAQPVPRRNIASYSRGAHAGNHPLGGLIAAPAAAYARQREPGIIQDVPLPQGPADDFGYTPQLPQKVSPNCPKSLRGMVRNSEGMHPTNWLLRRYSRSRLVSSPNSAGISPVNRLP